MCVKFRTRFTPRPTNMMKWLVVVIAINICVTCLYFIVYYSKQKTDKINQNTKSNIKIELKLLPDVGITNGWWQVFLCNLSHPGQHPATTHTQHQHPGQHTGTTRTLHQLFRHIEPSRHNTNVFLIDTSCNSHPKYRSWCSVESWAHRNPNKEIWFLLTSTDVQDFSGLPSTLLTQYPNLKIVGVGADKMFDDTPLKRLLESKLWTQNNTWPVELMSDMLRVLVLWHWGGIYSDTDVIAIKPFGLPLNSLGYETTFQIGSAVYSFQAHHPLLWSLMSDMSENFKPDLWGSIGPKAITRVVKRECGVEDLEPLLPQTPFTCGNLTLHTLKTFYPVDYTQSQELFAKNRGSRFDKIFKNTSAVHFWNKMSKDKVVSKGDNSLYEVAAKRFCPLTYDKATNEANTF